MRRSPHGGTCRFGVANDSVGMCRTVIEELREVLPGGFGRGGLLGGQGPNRREHGAVNCSAVVE
jgi:hypothetical protein